MTTRRRWPVGLGVAAAILALYCCVIEPFVLPEFIPIRRSRARIREELLKETPLGSTRTEVETVFGSHGWWGPEFFRGMGPIPGSEPPGSLSATFGRHSVAVIFDAIVYATWIFDENDRLTELRVRRLTYLEGLP